MTTLAIVGGGITGRSLLYALAKEQGVVTRVLLFQSNEFSQACSLRSTAIVAPRGVSAGHSPLGDLLLSGFHCFQSHVLNDAPIGVTPITQFTAATEKRDQFRLRYPGGSVGHTFAQLTFTQDLYMATESAFMISPEVYLEWLLQASRKTLEVIVIEDFVTEVTGDNKILTMKGDTFQTDKIVIAGGVGNRFWKQKGKPVQGAYWEFAAPDFGSEAFSLTLNSDNLIYHPQKNLLIGSSTSETSHELAPLEELKNIYQRLQAKLLWRLPDMSLGIVRVGMREKAPKRMPYLEESGNLIFLGGLYKNGYTLSLAMAQKLVPLLRRDALADKTR